MFILSWWSFTEYNFRLKSFLSIRNYSSRIYLLTSCKNCMKTPSIKLWSKNNFLKISLIWICSWSGRVKIAPLLLHQGRIEMLKLWTINNYILRKWLQRDSRFESCCSQLNVRYHNCFEQGAPWHSDNYIV